MGLIESLWANRARKYVPDNAFDNMVKTHESYQFARELDRAKYLNSFQRMSLSKLSGSMQEMREGSRVRISGYPQFVSSNVVENADKIYNSRAYGTRHRWHYGGGIFGGYSYSTTSGRGATVPVDIRYATYDIFSTPDGSSESVQIVAASDKRSSFAYYVTHFKAPELVKLDPSEQIDILGEITKTSDGNTQVLVKEILLQKQDAAFTSRR